MFSVSIKIKELNIISVIMEFFYSPSDCELRRSLIRRAGEISIQAGGENIGYFAENFLTKFLRADWTNPRSCLFLAVASLNNNRAKAYQAVRIKQDCFAYLSVCADKRQPETLELIETIKKNPPGLNFLKMTEKKIQSIKAGMKG